MIVRKILHQPGLLNKFDFFNDAGDTILWLRSVGEMELADHLNQRYQEWVRKMNKRYITLDWSNFGLKNHARNSGNSYSTIWPKGIVSRVLDNWSKAVPGTGETTLDRKILIPIDPTEIFCSPRANLVDGMAVKAEVKFRQAGEDPFVETYVEEAEARRCNAFVEVPAKRVDVVCYSAEALLENGGTRSTECDWEIVCLLATSGEKEPMNILAMARNFLQKPGGTFSNYTALEFAEAIYYWSTRRGIKVRMQPFIDETL